MSRPAIEIDNLGKKYVIRHQQAALREVFTNSLSRVGRKITDLSTRRPTISNVGPKEEFWALKDINFDVAKGDRIGIIGRNGSGKSTLLKILSRITDPTEGKILIRGRVASLLEVGTGFHPELTGRENIYLNGAILGMRRSEIKHKFDEIVAFSEVEKFLDTPVKRYSSGMYVRLAFAVAAHVEPDILIIDEVLAVGDMQFQKKCMAKMKAIADSGRTIFFVSHSMSSISHFCNKGVLLDKGQIRAIGNVDQVVDNYLSFNTEEKDSINLEFYEDRTGTGAAMFTWAQICDADLRPRQLFSIGDDIVVRFRFRIQDSFCKQEVKLSLGIRNSEGLQLCNMVDSDSQFSIRGVRSTEEISISLRDIRFYPDTFAISLWIGNIHGTSYDSVEDCLNFKIVDGGKLTSRILNKNTGLIFLNPEWKRIKYEIS